MNLENNPPAATILNLPILHSPGDLLLNLDEFGFDGPGGKLTNQEIDRIVYGA
jgi:hypothetical protein